MTTHIGCWEEGKIILFFRLPLICSAVRNNLLLPADPEPLVSEIQSPLWNSGGVQFLNKWYWLCLSRLCFWGSPGHRAAGF